MSSDSVAIAELQAELTKALKEWRELEQAFASHDDADMAAFYRQKAEAVEEAMAKVDEVAR